VPRLHTSFVLGYHGCDRAIGERVLAGNTTLAKSDRDYDWLGPGIYFWEADPQRALEWAREKKDRGDYEVPFVIGAVVDLGNCLDLMARDSLELLASAYLSFKGLHLQAQVGELPRNRKGRDKLLRYLDCAVIRHLHYILTESGIPPFDTVRGLFTEGGPAFRGSGFQRKTHVQIAVRTSESIKGFFRVPPPATSG
jgi:hypothetical protein